MCFMSHWYWAGAARTLPPAEELLRRNLRRNLREDVEHSSSVLPQNTVIRENAGVVPQPGTVWASSAQLLDLIFSAQLSDNGETNSPPDGGSVVDNHPRRPASSSVYGGGFIPRWLAESVLRQVYATQEAVDKMFASNKTVLEVAERGYFGHSIESRLLVHMWSLSVEEQYYMVWPALLLGLSVVVRKVLGGGGGGAVVRRREEETATRAGRGPHGEGARVVLDAPEDLRGPHDVRGGPASGGVVVEMAGGMMITTPSRKSRNGVAYGYEEDPQERSRDVALERTPEEHRPPENGRNVPPMRNEVNSLRSSSARFENLPSADRTALATFIVATFIGVTHFFFGLRRFWGEVSVSTAYYECRSWELMVGSVVALAEACYSIVLPRLGPAGPRGGRRSGQGFRVLVNVLGMLGLVLIFYAAFLHPAPSQYDPGAFRAAIPPAVAGAALFIAAGSTAEMPFVNQLLARPPFVAIGLVSYPLYLYHWPLIGLFRYSSVPLSVFPCILILILSFVFAAASYWFVETPVRLSRTPNKFFVTRWVVPSSSNGVRAEFVHGCLTFWLLPLLVLSAVITTTIRSPSPAFFATEFVSAPASASQRSHRNNGDFGYPLRYVVPSAGDADSSSVEGGGRGQQRALAGAGVRSTTGGGAVGGTTSAGASGASSSVKKATTVLLTAPTLDPAQVERATDKNQAVSVGLFALLVFANPPNATNTSTKIKNGTTNKTNESNDTGLLVLATNDANDGSVPALIPGVFLKLAPISWGGVDQQPKKWQAADETWFLSSWETPLECSSLSPLSEDDFVAIQTTAANKEVALVSRKQVLVLGDSHLFQVLPVLDLLLRDSFRSAWYWARAGAPFLIREGTSTLCRNPGSAPDHSPCVGTRSFPQALLPTAARSDESRHRTRYPQAM